MFQLDEKIFSLIHQLVGKSRLLDLLAIFFADYAGYLMVIIALFLIFSGKKWKNNIYNLAFVSLTLLLSGGIFTETIRFFYDKARPFVKLVFNPLISQGIEPSFPSRHMAFYFALSLAVYYLGHKRWFLVFCLVSLLMGFARVFVGVHWPLDIVSGIIVAFLSAFMVHWLLAVKKD